MSFVIQKKIKKEGLTRFVDEQDDLKKLEFSILRLDRKAQWKHCNEYAEIFLVLLSGCIEVEAGSWSSGKLARRRNVFSHKAEGVYIPLAEPFVVYAYEASEVAICMSTCNEQLEPFVVRRKDVRRRKVGKGTYRRYVHDILKSKDPASRLLVGETFNPPGHWSSYPPHKHDQEDGQRESKHEELYFFKTRPENGWAIQRIFSENLRLNETMTVMHNQVTMIPKGYHPVCAPPENHVYYLWVLSGNRRQLRMKEL